MEKVYTNSDYSSQILSQICELWRGNKYCDAVLNLQDEKFKLHKLVLMAACPNILRCLAHTEENNVFEFYLPEDSEKSVVVPVVNYLYIGSIQLNMTNVYGIEKLAKQLRLSTLSQFCHDFISLLESEKFSQSSLQPGIHQENIPKQESTEVEKVVDPKAIDALINSANATLREINNGASSVPELTDVLGHVSCSAQLTDGIGQLPFASKSIKTELDTFIIPTLEETISMNEKKTITIEPLNNILQFSKSDNSMTTALATSSACKSHDSATLDVHLGSGRLESDPFSHQTASNGMLNPQINSCQVSTRSRFTPELNIVACKPSTSQSQGGEGDDIDLVMTAEDENFDDSDDEWVPKGNESSDSDFYPESALDRSTKTKRKMSTNGPKAKKSRKNDSLTAKKKKVRGDKMNQGDTKNGSEPDGKSQHISRYGRTLKPSISYRTIGSLNIDGLEDCKMQMGSSKGSNLLKDGQEVSEDLASKRKDNKIPLDAEELKSMLHKIKVAEYADELGLEAAAAHFNVSNDTVKDWMLLKNYFKKKTKKANKKTASKLNIQHYIKIGEHTALEDKVINWLLETKYNPNVTDDLSTIGYKTTEFAKEIGKPDLKIGILWLKQILEKYVSVTKIDETGDVCTEEFRLQVTDYAKEHGVKAASELYGLDVNTVGWWTRKYKTKVVCKEDDALNPNTKSSTRKRYTVNFKIEAVKCAEKLGNRAVARIYGVPETNVRLWRKHKEQLSYNKGNVLKLKPTVSPRQHSLLESLVKHWIISERRKVTGAEIRAKALSFAEQANSPGFKGSYKWLYQFVKCHSLEQYVKTECSKEENFEYENRKEVARSLERDSHGRFKSRPGETFLSNELKLEVVRFAETNGNEEAVKKYKINETVICNWRLKKSYLSQRMCAQKEKEK
ncbi:hypothetical protein ACJMK2_020802 [Sinanodonta woodiana]|uniref:BTB domain-containing protein n=1 Tax=Sinanodonta woodiana TaxID=1069815 RepID=A0ABD3U2U0_SINWO